MNIVFHSANDLPVGQRQADGYVDATALCKTKNKRFDNYKKHEGYKPFIEALSNSLKMSELDLVQTKRGKAGSVWVHPQVAIHLGMWVSPEFAVMVTQWVVSWMTAGQNPLGRSQPQPQTPPPSASPKSLPPAPGWKPEVWDALPLEDKQHFSESQDQAGERLRRERADIARYLNRCWGR